MVECLDWTMGMKKVMVTVHLKVEHMAESSEHLTVNALALSLVGVMDNLLESKSELSMASWTADSLAESLASLTALVLVAEKETKLVV